MGFIKDILITLFESVHSVVQFIIPYKNVSYGLTIILFTGLIRLILLPLNIKQTKSQAKLQEVQPQMQELQKKYKNDPQKGQQEIMKLYKENNVSPMGGCLPILVQLPVFWAMYQILYNLKDISGVSFLWLQDLSMPDKLYILPVLSAGLSFFSMKIMMPKDGPGAKTTNTTNIIMTGFSLFITMSVKSALGLYWVSNSFFQLVQNLTMKKLGLIGKPAVKKDDTKAASSKDLFREVSTDSIKTKGKKKGKK